MKLYTTLLAMSLLTFTSLSKDITGKIIDEAGKPIKGAAVSIAGKSDWAISNSIGEFQLLSEGVPIGSSKMQSNHNNMININENGLITWHSSSKVEEVTVISMKGQQLFKRSIGPTISKMKLPQLGIVCF